VRGARAPSSDGGQRGIRFRPIAFVCGAAAIAFLCSVTSCASKESKDTTPAITSFHYREILSTGGTPSPVTYVYGLGLISSTDANGNQLYYFGDALGSTRLTPGGDDYQYDAFGALQPGFSPGSQRFLFAGQQLDAKPKTSTGLYYMRARYYDPSIGRFLTPDPVHGSIQSGQSQNRYAYEQPDEPD
jgi:RHS repeat-associated protein